MSSMRRPHSNWTPGEKRLFTGQASVGLEPSGRIAIPSPWKHRFQASAFVLPRLQEEEPYVMFFSLDGLKNRLAELRSEHHRGALLRQSSEVKVDSQRRVVIPEVVQLLGGASYVAILGGGDHLRMMSEASAAYTVQFDEDVLHDIL